jgi:SAM-dependent methyltransferase
MTLALGTSLVGEDVSKFHTQVAPRCRALFEERFLEPMTLEDEALVLHLGCRTGFHDEELAARAGASALVGVDASPEAIALAAAGSGAAEGRFAYHASALPTQLPDASFSHAVSLYSLALQGDDWGGLVHEAARLLKPGGQLLLALPLRGSYGELLDLLREYAFASGDDEVARVIAAAAAGRPNIEQATELLEDMGFDDVDIAMHRLKLEYAGGQEFLDDPVTRLLFEPHLGALAPQDPGAAVEHVRQALACYWSELPFELSLTLGYISARR